MPGLAGHAQSAEIALLKAELGQAGQVVRQANLSLEAAREDLLLDGLRHGIAAEADPDAPSLGPGLGVGHQHAIGPQHEADERLLRPLDARDGATAQRVRRSRSRSVLLCRPQPQQPYLLAAS